MNILDHLHNFCEFGANDGRLGPAHISLYMALFDFWREQQFVSPFYISRAELMRLAKINGNATYQKCIKDLDELGYIRYKPSHKPQKGSEVSMVDLTKMILKTDDNTALEKFSTACFP